MCLNDADEDHVGLEDRVVVHKVLVAELMDLFDAVPIDDAGEFRVH